MEVNSTVLYMENMYKFFQLHNVSNRRHYIHSLNSSIAPYMDVSDERLQWLNETFASYIDDIQENIRTVCLKGFTAETSHALKFTAKSTYLCTNFLLSQDFTMF